MFDLKKLKSKYNITKIDFTNKVFLSIFLKIINKNKKIY